MPEVQEQHTPMKKLITILLPYLLLQVTCKGIGRALQAEEPANRAVSTIWPLPLRTGCVGHSLPHRPQFKCLDFEFLRPSQHRAGERATYATVPMQQVRIQPDGEMGSSPKTHRVVTAEHKKIIALSAVRALPAKLNGVWPKLKNKAFPTPLIPWIHSPRLSAVHPENESAKVFDNQNATSTTSPSPVKALQAKATMLTRILQRPVTHSAPARQRRGEGRGLPLRQQRRLPTACGCK
jgi:hypothetical protein